MPAVSCYLYVHQPVTLRTLSLTGRAEPSIDVYRTREQTRRLVRDCLLPVTDVLLAAHDYCRPDFRVGLAVTGTTLDLFERFAPAGIAALRKLVARDAIELLGATDANSVAALYRADVFVDQLTRHRRRIEALFDCSPRILCPTALLYGDRCAAALTGMDWDGIIIDGHTAAGSAAGEAAGIYATADGVALLARTTRPSVAVTEQFADRNATGWPMTAPRFLERLRQDADVAVHLLGFDLRVFGRWHAADSGVLEWLRYLPVLVAEAPDLAWRSPADLLDEDRAPLALPPDTWFSAAEWGGDATAWLGASLRRDVGTHLFSHLDRARTPGVGDADFRAALGQWLQDAEILASVAPPGSGRLPEVGCVPGEGEYERYITVKAWCAWLTGSDEAVAPT